MYMEARPMNNGTFTGMPAMWEAIRFAGSPLTIIAFLGAVGAVLYRARLYQCLRRIEQVPVNERAPLVDKTLDTLGIPIADLTKKERYGLFAGLMKAKGRNFRLTVVLAFLFGIGCLISWTVSPSAGNTNQASGSDESPPSRSQTPAVTVPHPETRVIKSPVAGKYSGPYLWQRRMMARQEGIARLCISDDGQVRGSADNLTIGQAAFLQGSISENGTIELLSEFSKEVFTLKGTITKTGAGHLEGTVTQYFGRAQPFGSVRFDLRSE
jgi:hypothetical protein